MRRRRLRIKAPHQTMSRGLGVVKTDHTTSSHSESWRLSNSIRIRNQVQRPRLVYHLQFTRELRALQKAKSFQDPVAITTNPLVSSSSFLSRGLGLDDGDDSRDVGGARDEKCSSKAVKKESWSNGSRNRRDSSAQKEPWSNGSRNRRDSSAQKESWGDGLGRRRRDSMAPVQGKNRDARRRSSSHNRASGRKWMDTEKAKSTSVREEDEEEEECQADAAAAAATRDSKLTKEFVCENSRNRACLLSNYRRNQGLQGNDLGESRFQTEEEQQEEEQQQQQDDDDDELSPAERRETMSTRSLRRAPSSSRHREGNTYSGHVPILLRTQRSSSKTTTRRFKAVRHTSNLRKPEAAMQIKETRIDSREEEAEERQEVRACQKSSQQNRGDEDQQHQQQQRPELPRKLVVYKELEPLLQGYGRRLPWNHDHHHRQQQQQLVSKKSNFHEGERAWKKKPGGPDPVTDPPAGLLKKPARRTKRKVMMTLVSMQQQSSRNGSELFSAAASPQDQYNNQQNVAAAATDSTTMISSSDSPEVSPPFPFLMRKEDDDDDSGHGSSSSNSSMRFALKPSEPNHGIVLSHAAAREQLHANQSLLHSDKHGMKNKQQKARCGESSLQQLKEPKMMMMMHTRMAQASEDEQKLLAQCRTLSQKYRPKSFNELMGHTMVVKSLTMAIRKHKIAPAYLFTGPRGTGKTTAARIFAAAISCSVVATSEVESQECGNCRRNSFQECAARACQKDDDDDKEEDSCSSDDDADDVKEIDAAVASNMDLQHMLQQSMLMRQRNLSSPSSFSSSPNSCCCCHHRHRYKVLIVEGCHLLSSQIWNAFLTLLEEPPAYLVFILITTESDQLPLTVTSRYHTPTHPFSSFFFPFLLTSSDRLFFLASDCCFSFAHPLFFFLPHMSFLPSHPVFYSSHLVCLCSSHLAVFFLPQILLFSSSDPVFFFFTSGCLSSSSHLLVFLPCIWFVHTSGRFSSSSHLVVFLLPHIWLFFFLASNCFSSSHQWLHCRNLQPSSSHWVPKP